MKIGITSQLSRNVWGGSLKQSCIFLYDCLQEGGNEVFYINDSDKFLNFNKDHVGYAAGAMVKANGPEIDILILHSWVAGEEYLEAFRRRRPKCKIVLYHHGNRFALDNYAITAGGNYLNPMPSADAIWTHEGHGDKIGYIQALHRFEGIVNTAPFLWSPHFIEEERVTGGVDFDPGRPVKCVILEPNRDYAKTCLVPILACERANNKDIHGVSVMNTDNLKNNRFFLDFVSDLEINKEKKLFLNRRWKTPDVLRKMGQFVVSSQERDPLSYLHLECFHLGVPIIHDSHPLSSCGYYYNSGNVDMAANQIKNAIMNHKENLNDYRTASKSITNKYSPSNSRNVERLNRLIFSLK
jgi:hypothetical protein